MTFNDHSPDIATVSAQIAQAFEIAGALHALPGGEGRTYRAGEVIYRREDNVVEASYLADVYDRLPGTGFRVPKPIRTKQGGWISPTGWSAWTFVAGSPATTADVPAVIAAIRAFHQALAHEPHPTYLAERATPYDRADHAAWDTPLDAIDSPLEPLVTQLLHLRKPIPVLNSQLIHGDLNEDNILVASELSPAIIDFTPYWRPPEFALAIFAYWLGPYRGDMSILPAFAQVQEFDQMLVRAALRTVLITQEFGKAGGSLERAAEYFRPSVAIITEWIERLPNST